jgi:hypothetical protein
MCSSCSYFYIQYLCQYYVNVKPLPPLPGDVWWATFYKLKMQHMYNFYSNACKIYQKYSLQYDTTRVYICFEKNVDNMKQCSGVISL